MCEWGDSETIACLATRDATALCKFGYAYRIRKEIYVKLLHRCEVPTRVAWRVSGTLVVTKNGAIVIAG